MIAQRTSDGFWKAWLFAAPACVLLAFSAFAQAQGGKHPDTSGWKNLLADDLSNAILPKDSWVVENGVLHAKTHDTLWTKEAYGNFVLDLEFKVSRDANSGIFLRAGDIRNVLSALEVQVHETTDGSKYGMVGAIYDAKPPSRKMAKPAGEWNRFTITCRESLVSIVFNGEEVINMDLNDWKEPRKNPDGTANKFAVALKDFARKGPIGFQGIHGRGESLVWYRNVKIKELEASAAQAATPETPSALASDPAGWVDIMPPTDLKGWYRVTVPPGGQLGRAQWHVDAARKVLVCDGDGGHDMLLTEQEYGDAVFHFEFCYTKVEGKTGYNSGAYVRNSRDGAIWHQAQFGDAKDGFLFGQTPGPDGKKKSFNLKNQVKAARVRPAGEWNTMEITAQGGTLTLWVNGAVTCRFEDCGAKQGHLGLEGEGYRIEFRNLKVKPL